MADPSAPMLVSPVACERYRNTELASDFIAPPYDVISAADRQNFLSRSAHNIVRLILPEGDGDRYKNAAGILERWRGEGVLVRDQDPGVYVIRQQFETPDGERHSRTGVIAGVAVEPYSTGRVRPHERTHKGPKEDRLALMRSTSAMFEALLMMSRDGTGGLRSQLESATRSDPDLTANLDGVSISLWRVTGNSAEKIAAAASAGPVYIADGHHRYETAVAYLQENRDAQRTLGLVVPVDDPGLVVLPTHRLLKGKPVDENELRSMAGGLFRVDSLESLDEGEAKLSAAGPETTCCVISLASGELFFLRLDPAADLSHLPFSGARSMMALDVAKIDSLIVDQLLDRGGGNRELSYSADARWAVDEVVSGRACVAVILNPVGVNQVLDVCDDQTFMPQKSTFFAPKVPSGLVILGW